MTEIGDFIRRFMKEHGLTEKKMAAILGLRGSNLQSQLNGGKLSGSAAVQFEQMMFSSFELTEAEREALHMAVHETAQRGESDAIKTREMWAYVRGDILQQGEMMIFQGSTGQTLPLYERYAGARNLKITLLNAPYSAIYRVLPRLIEEKGALVNHYVLVNDDAPRTIRLAAEMQRMIVYDGYECFTRLEEKDEQCVYGLERSDCMVCAWEDETGFVWHDMIVFTEPCQGLLLEKPFVPGRGGLGLDEQKYARLRRTLNSGDGGQFSDYIQMIVNYAQLEKGRTVYALRPDLCMVSVPPEILRDAALADGGNLEFNEETAAAIDQMTRLFEQRYANIEQKHARTWTFLKRASMENFARTGVLSAHFWGMRPFTPAERRRILAEQLRLMWLNPGYRLFFLRDDCWVRDIDLCCYEGYGVLVSEVHTDYNIENGYSEVLMGYKRFMKLFEEFAQEKLVAQCFSERETRAILKNLIAITVEVEKQEG